MAIYLFSLIQWTRQQDWDENASSSFVAVADQMYVFELWLWNVGVVDRIYAFVLWLCHVTVTDWV